MAEGKKTTTSKKGTITKKVTAPKSEIKEPTSKPEKEGTVPKSDQITQIKKPLSDEIEVQRKEFEQLLAKFRTMDDPVERYIKRQEMMKIQRYLKEHGVKIDIP